MLRNRSIDIYIRAFDDISRYLSIWKSNNGMKQSDKPSIQRKELAYKNNLLCDLIHSNVMNKCNILYVAFDASFLLLLPTYFSKLWVNI